MNRTWDSSVRSANATSVLCRPSYIDQLFTQCCEAGAIFEHQTAPKVLNQYPR